MAKKPSTTSKDATVTKATTAATGAALATVLAVQDMVYDRNLLATIAAGTDSEAKSAMIPAADSVKLIELDLVTYNPAGPGADGLLQVALSPKGREAFDYQNSDEGKKDDATTAGKRKRTVSDIPTPTNFTISNVAIPIPDHVRGTRGNELYPFRELGIGHSFHIPTADDKVQEVIAGRITSSISTANDRYFDTPHPQGNVTGARFLARKVGADDPSGLGVRVWRIEDLTEEGRAEIVKSRAEAKAKAEEAKAKAQAGATTTAVTGAPAV